MFVECSMHATARVTVGENQCVFFQIDDDLREEISIYVRYTTNLKEGNAIGCMVCVFN